MVLENAAVDVPTVFGARLARGRRDSADPDPFKDVQVAEYIGEAIHCAQGDTICANSSSARRSADAAADRAGRLQRLPGAVRRASTSPRRSAAAPNAFHNGYQVTDANGNLVDLDGNTLQEPFSAHAGLPGLQPDRDAEPRRAGRHAGGRHPRHLRLHLRPARARRRTRGPAARPHREPATRPAARPRRLVLRRERPALRRGVPEVLRAARRRRHHAGEHAVRDQRRGERPVRGRERRAARPQPTPGRLRRRHRAVQLRRRARSASCRPTSRACSPARPELRHAVRRRAAGRVDLRPRPAGARTTRPSASSNATRRR